MAFNTTPDEINPDLQKFHKRWKKNRDFLAGRDAVEAAGETYLPKPLSKMEPAEYANYVKTVRFQPYAIKIMTGNKGLIFKNKPDLIGDSVAKVQEIITPRGDSLETLSAKVLQETFTTNFTGLMVDHPNPDPSVFPDLNAKNQIELGYRPFLSMFPAETILDLDWGLVGNTQKFTYVRLLESANVVREMLLEGGVYKVRTYVKQNGDWQGAVENIPTKDGVAFNEIPFWIVSTNHERWPTPAPFEHIVDLNCDIWILQGRMSQAVKWTSNPIVAMSKLQKEDAEIEEYPTGPGVVWTFQGEAELNIHSFDGKNIDSIERLINSASSDMARTGSRIIADDKAAPEAAETIAIRQESDNASLNGQVRAIGAYITQALRFMAKWMGDPVPQDTKFSFKPDFSASGFNADRLSTVLAYYQAGQLTDEVLFFELKKAGIVDDVVDYQTFRDALSQQMIDRPIVQPGNSTGL